MYVCVQCRYACIHACLLDVFLYRFYELLKSCPRPTPDIKAPKLPELEPDSYDKNTRVQSCIGSKTTWLDFLNGYRSLPVSHYMDEFAKLKNQWTQCLDDDQLFAAYMFDPNQPQRCTIRLDAHLDSTIEGVIAVMSEVEMTSSWVPYIKFPMR